MFDKKLLMQHIVNKQKTIEEQNKAIKEGLDHLGVSHAQSRGEPLFPGDRGAGAGQQRPKEGPHGSYITFGSYEFPASLHPVDGWIHGHVGSDGNAGTHRRMVYSKQPPPGPRGTPLEDHHLSTEMRQEMGRDAMRDIGEESNPYGGAKKEVITKKDRKPKPSDRIRKSDEEKKENLKAKEKTTVTKKPGSSVKTKQSIMNKLAEKQRNKKLEEQTYLDPAEDNHYRRIDDDDTDHRDRSRLDPERKRGNTYIAIHPKTGNPHYSHGLSVFFGDHGRAHVLRDHTGDPVTVTLPKNSTHANFVANPRPSSIVKDKSHLKLVDRHLGG
jgi:hypothetical protein